MKIAVWHNLPSGGGKRSLVDHVDGLVARGHDVRVWTTSVARAALPRVTTDVPIRIIELGIDPSPRGGSLPPWPELRRRMRAMDRHLDIVADEINAGDFDVAYVGACQYFRSVDLGRRLHAPSLIFVQEPYRWLYEAMPDLPWAYVPRRPQEPLKTWARRRLRDAVTITGLRRQVYAESAAVRGYQRVLVNSAFSRESVTRIYGIDSQVCYLGVDGSRLVNDSQSREPMILGLGAVVPEKGLLRAVAAVAALPEPRPPVVWVGNIESPEYRELVALRAAEVGVDLEFRVAIPDSELAELLARAALLLYTPHLEPFGLAAIEASAAGLPVVALAEGGPRETVVDGLNGLLVTDLGELPGAMSRILDNPALAEKFGAEGRSLAASKWSLEAAIDRIERHLTEVAQAGR